MAFGIFVSNSILLQLNCEVKFQSSLFLAHLSINATKSEIKFEGEIRLLVTSTHRLNNNFVLRNNA